MVSSPQVYLGFSFCLCLGFWDLVSWGLRFRVLGV